MATIALSKLRSRLTPITDPHTLIERYGITGNVPYALQDAEYPWQLHDGDLVIQGDFIPDLPLVVTGDLIVHGNYTDPHADQDFSAVVVTGDLVARVVTKHGMLWVGGDLFASCIALESSGCSTYSVDVAGTSYAPLRVHVDEDDPAAPADPHLILVPELAATVLPHPDEDDPDYDDLWEAWHDQGPGLAEAFARRLDQGLPVFVDPAPRWYAAPATAQARIADTPTARLEQLAGPAGDTEVARRMAGRVVLPTTVANLLVTHPEAIVRSALATRSDLPEPVLQALRDDVHPAVHRALNTANLDDTTSVSALIECGDQASLVLAAGAPHLSQEQRTTLLGSQLAAVRQAMLTRDDVRWDELAAHLHDDPSTTVRRTAVRTAQRLFQIDPGTFSRLVKDPDTQIRTLAASSRWWADDTLDSRMISEILLADPEPTIRVQAAYPRSLDWPDLIDAAAHDTDPEVRAGVAMNIMAPEDLLIALADDPSWAVLSSLVGNPLAPPAALRRIAERLIELDGPLPHTTSDDEKRLASGTLVDLVGHPSLPSESLAALWTKSLPYFNEWTMTEQPNWPVSILVPGALNYAHSTLDEDERPAYRQISAAAAEQAAAGWADSELVLDMMASCPIYYLQGFAAASRFTPASTLKRMAVSASEESHLDKLARNPSMPWDMGATLIEKGLTYEMLKNPTLDLRVLARIGGTDMTAELASLTPSAPPQPAALHGDKPVSEAGGIPLPAPRKDFPAMPRIVFGQEADDIYAAYARKLLRARLARGEHAPETPSIGPTA